MFNGFIKHSRFVWCGHAWKWGYMEALCTFCSSLLWTKNFSKKIRFINLKKANKQQRRNFEEKNAYLPGVKKNPQSPFFALFVQRKSCYHCTLLENVVSGNINFPLYCSQNKYHKVSILNVLVLHAQLILLSPLS